MTRYQKAQVYFFLAYYNIDQKLVTDEQYEAAYHSTHFKKWKAGK